MFILTVWCAILTVNWSLIMSTLQAKQPEGCSWACLFDTITIKIQLIFISKSTINSRSTYPTPLSQYCSPFRCNVTPKLRAYR